MIHKGRLFFLSLLFAAFAVPSFAQDSLPTLVAPAPAEGSQLPKEVSQKEGVLIRKILIQGAKRIEKATVLSHLGFKVEDRITEPSLDAALRRLYKTGLFSDVSLNRQGGTVTVRVIENPFIVKVAFEGNDRIKDKDLEANVRLRARRVLSKSKVQEDVNRILSLYHKSGRFSASVVPQIISLSENRVDLIYKITEGPVTSVTRIAFVGNRSFSDETLKGVVSTREYRWYRFLSDTDVYDAERISFDGELLRRFYLNHGFADFSVRLAQSELNASHDGFLVTFVLNEGHRYTFGNSQMTSDILGFDVTPLQGFLSSLKKGAWYNADKVRSMLSALRLAIQKEGYAFFTIDPSIQQDKKKLTIGLHFNIKQSDRVYLDKINIDGNTSTLDRVIRREMLLGEGSPYSARELAESRRRLLALRFFKNVKIDTVPGSSPHKKNVNIKVTEQPTGSFNVAGGYSNLEGFFTNLSLSEANLLGTGRLLQVSAHLSKIQSTYDVSFQEPYFLGRHVAAGIRLYNTNISSEASAPYTAQNLGLSLSASYRLTERLSQRLSYDFVHQKIGNVSKKASPVIKQAEGLRTISSVTQSLSYDQTDNPLKPTSGYAAYVSTTLAGFFGSTRYAKLQVSSMYYYPFSPSVEGVLSLTGRVIRGLFGQHVFLTDQFSLSADEMRGFASNGVGPRDKKTLDGLGGRYLAAASAEVSFPIGFPESVGIKGAVFSDAGLVTGADVDKSLVYDSHRPRLSVGFGLRWFAPIGLLLKLDWGYPIVKESYDVTQRFLFSLGTHF